MIKSRRAVAVIAAFAIALFFVAPQAALSASELDFEQPHSIPLPSAIPGVASEGPGYSLNDSVFANGFSHDYVIATVDYGEFTPTSDYLLDVRLSEIHALQQLAEIRKSEAYIVAVAKAGAAPLYLIKDLATRPIETVTGVPKGIWRAGTKAVSWLGGDRRPRAESEDSATRELLGVSRKKRSLAASLNVDPYTSNMKLQDELDRVAWASFAGGMSVTLAMGAVAIPPIASLTYRVTNLTRKTNQLVTSVSGGDLYKINRKTLHEMGFGEQQTAAFLNNPHLSPTRKSAITLAVESMKGASGLEHVLALGAKIENENDAIRLQRTAELMSAYHENIAPVETVVSWDNHLFVKGSSGQTTAIVPADRLLWTPQSRNLADAMRVASGPESNLAIWTSGVFSDTVRTVLTQRGVSLKDQVDF